MSKRKLFPKKFNPWVVLAAVVLVSLGQVFGWYEPERARTPSNNGKTASQTQQSNNAETTETIDATITRFVDGDTFTVTIDGSKETVRIIGLDTPETHAPGKPVQCYGPAASAYLKQLVGTQKVRLKVDPLNDNRDKYGRLLRHVYLPDGASVAGQIIKNGYGFAYTVYPFTGKNSYITAENDARQQARGLWGNCEVTEKNGRKQTGAQTAE